MKTQQSQKKTETTGKDPLVIGRTEEGFRVYAASDPSKSYVVSGSPEDPSCTCPDFQHPEGDAPWYCKHILAVLDQVGGKNGQPRDSRNDEKEERLAIQEEGTVVETQAKSNDRPTHMFIKRSVSPDGRIDSLSVEFSCPIDGAPIKEIKSKAVTTLRIQSEIVESFLRQNGNNGHQPTNNEEDADGAVPATLVSVGGMNGKWGGRRLYLTIRSNGNILKLFGGRKQLKQHVASAGFPDIADDLDEGVRLNLPCRIITKPSDDGKWLNVEEVLPANAHSGSGKVQL